MLKSLRRSIAPIVRSFPRLHSALVAQKMRVQALHHSVASLSPRLIRPKPTAPHPNPRHHPKPNRSLSRRRVHYHAVEPVQSRQPVHRERQPGMIGFDADDDHGFLPSGPKSPVCESHDHSPRPLDARNTEGLVSTSLRYSGGEVGIGGRDRYEPQIRVGLADEKRRTSYRSQEDGRLNDDEHDRQNDTGDGRNQADRIVQQVVPSEFEHAVGSRPRVRYGRRRSSYRAEENNIAGTRTGSIVSQAGHALQSRFDSPGVSERMNGPVVAIGYRTPAGLDRVGECLERR